MMIVLVKTLLVGMRRETHLKGEIIKTWYQSCVNSQRKEDLAVKQDFRGSSSSGGIGLVWKV